MQTLTSKKGERKSAQKNKTASSSPDYANWNQGKQKLGPSDEKFSSFSLGLRNSAKLGLRHGFWQR